MVVHDWTRVFPGTFHHFHGSWITHLAEALNRGLLPADYYALSEQHAGDIVPDVCPDEVATYRLMRRTLTIRHRSNRRIVAIVEIVSPGNKDGEQHLEQFVNKSVEALREGIHLLVIDLHPPGSNDPHGIHAAIWEIVGGRGFVPLRDRPLTLAAYMADRMPQAFVEPIAVGQPMPDMPLFLTVGWYIDVPLETTYTAAYEGMPLVVKDAIEGRSPSEWEQT